MLSLILSVGQLRQPSGLTQRSRFGSRDLGPPANQHSRVLSMPMANQIQSGDPINQTFISKAPRNTGPLLSDCVPFAWMCECCGSFWYIQNWNALWLSQFICDANKSRERERKSKRARAGERGSPLFGFKFRLQIQDCVLDLHTSHSACPQKEWSNHQKRHDLYSLEMTLS